jgi:hypothetical protein
MRLEGDGWMPVERSVRNTRFIQKTIQAKPNNRNCPGLSTLEIRKSVAQLFAAIVELHIVAALSGVLYLTDDQPDAFLAYRVAGREIEDEEVQIENPPQFRTSLG